MLNTILPILLFAALALAVLGAVKRFLMWRRGRPAKVDWLGGLLAMPRRYLVDLHHVVERDKYMSKTHVATAGGFVLAAVLAIVVHGFGLHSKILAFALLAATVLMFVGAVLMRGAGCTFNDIVDRDIDDKVARTRLRPIPSGQVTTKRAAAFLVLQARGVGPLASVGLPP